MGSTVRGIGKLSFNFFRLFIEHLYIRIATKISFLYLSYKLQHDLFQFMEKGNFAIIIIYFFSSTSKTTSEPDVLKTRWISLMLMFILRKIKICSILLTAISSYNLYA